MDFLYRKIAAHLPRPHAIFASNTSGLSINALAAARLARASCGRAFAACTSSIHRATHLRLVEIIPCKDSLPGVLDDLERFLVTTVGKGVIRAKDTPNFVANRVGVFSMLATIANAAKFGIRFDVVDDLTGPRLGRPKSATFRTADVVGLDTFAHVVKTMQDTLPQDPWHGLYQSPSWLAKLIAAGALGAKTQSGIYQKKGKRHCAVLDPASGEYVDAGTEADASVVEILKLDDPAQKLRRLRESEHVQAQFLWKGLLPRHLPLHRLSLAGDRALGP